MDDATLLIVGAIVVLIVTSAFFSGSETALTAASRPRMHQLEKSGNARAVTVNRLRAQQEKLIGGLLVGNNLVNIGASALATSLAITWFADAGVAIATGVMTLLVLVFAEVMPKTFALRHADGVALAVARPVRAVVMALSPATALVQFLVRALFAVGGATLGARESATARVEELRGAIDLLARINKKAADAGFMLRNILDMGEVEVGEIMTHRTELDMIDAGLPIQDIIQQVLSSQYTRLPLYRGEPDNIVGVVHAKELFRAIRDAGGNLDRVDITKVASLPWFIPESTSLHHQLHAFRRRRAHFALVVDEYGALMGVVTLEDILEEIVGEIDDEHDVPVAGVRPQPDGSYLIDGKVTIRELNREFGWELPDEPAATLAGLVLHEARLIPEVGQSFAFYGFRFDIMQRDGNQITSIRLSPWPAPRESGSDADGVTVP